MTLLELAQIQGKQIQLLYPDTSGNWYASLEGCEIKDGSLLVSPIGRGPNPGIALRSYVEEIRGKTMVKGAWTDKRQEFKVPMTLEAI